MHPSTYSNGICDEKWDIWLRDAGRGMRDAEVGRLDQWGSPTPAASGPWGVLLKPVLAFNRQPSGVRYWLRRSGRVERDQDAASAVALRDVERLSDEPRQGGALR